MQFHIIKIHQGLGSSINLLQNYQEQIPFKLSSCSNAGSLMNVTFSDLNNSYCFISSDTKLTFTCEKTSILSYIKINFLQELSSTINGNLKKNGNTIWEFSSKKTKDGFIIPLNIPIIFNTNDIINLQLPCISPSSTNVFDGYIEFLWQQ